VDLDLERIRISFLAESEEDLALVEEALLVLEKTPSDPEPLACVFRKVHTLKGNASALGLESLGGFAHRMEDLLHALRAGRQPVTEGVVSYLLQVVDVLRTLVPAAVAGQDTLTPACDLLLQRLDGDVLLDGGAAATAVPAGPAVPESLPESEPAAEAARTLRIETGKLDFLLSVTSEIAIARGRLGLLIENQGAPELAAAYRTLERLLSTMHHSVTKVRMVPIAPLLRQHARTVRDLARAQHKRAELIVSDQGVEVDNSLIEQLKAPLTHMIRNAVDHGLETPDVRQRAGKDPTGRIDLEARHEASGIVIEVKDDGAGLDRARILEKARGLGLVPDGAQPSDHEIDQLIFSPGLSTARGVTSTSGRGVGMDVVQRQLSDLGGTVEIVSFPGHGTTLTLRMPLTLAMIEGLVLRVAGATMVVPMAGVARCVELSAATTASSPEGRLEDGERRDGVLNIQGRAVPFARLRALFGLHGDPPPHEVALIIDRGHDQVGLAVDSLLGRSQIVVKPPGRFFKGLPAVSGLTILGDGHVAPILNVSGLLKALERRGSAA
jgi:two-component system chemotaxis sensor kinase CheA